MPILYFLLSSVIGSIIVKLLISLGIGFTTYTVLLPNLLDFINAQIGSLPPVAVQLLGILRIDILITIFISAYAARGLTGIFMNKITP